MSKCRRKKPNRKTNATKNRASSETTDGTTRPLCYDTIMAARRNARTKPALKPRNGHLEHIFTSKMNKKRTGTERWADWMTNAFGTILFFNLNAFLFIVWVIVNTGYIPGIKPFDPYPFNFLTMVVSLEAIFLSVIVLITQNRAAKIADLREEIDFQVNIRTEHESQKILRMLECIERRLNIPKSVDRELAQFERGLDLDVLEQEIRKSINN